MSKISKRLPEAEFEIMQIVWGTDEKKQYITSSYILSKLEGKRGWALPTLMTVLTRLMKKGFLRCEKIGRSNLYHVAISQKEYMKFEADKIVNKTFDGDIDFLVKTLVTSNVVKKEQLVAALEKLNK